MSAADVAGVGVDAAAASACGVSQSQPQGPLKRGQSQDNDRAVPRNFSAAGASRASPAKGTGNAQGSEQAEACAKKKVVVGYWREHSTLTHVIIRDAGHMVCPEHGIMTKCPH